MSRVLSRRAVLVSGLAAGLGACASRHGQEIDMRVRLQALQQRVGGKLGVHVVDTGSRRHVSFNAESRFAMASTFKVLLAGAVLERVERLGSDLGERIPVTAGDLIVHSPVVAQAVSSSLSLAQLCAATVQLSDNAAANLLLAHLGGPASVTDFVRRLGDRATRLDRTEPELNSNVPGDLRDTTTPLAMSWSLEAMLLGERLSSGARMQLMQWMEQASTGLRRLRAGLPPDWRVGDKTGTGENGAVNTVAIVHPPGSAPLIFSVFMSGSSSPRQVLEAAQAELAHQISQELAEG